MFGKNMEVEELNKKLNEKINNLEKIGMVNENRLDSMERIITHYIPGKITYYMFRQYSFISVHMYKDGIEYLLPRLELYNPTFKVGEYYDVIYIKDKRDDKDFEYTVQLKWHGDPCIVTRTK